MEQHQDNHHEHIHAHEHFHQLAHNLGDLCCSGQCGHVEHMGGIGIERAIMEQQFQLAFHEDNKETSTSTTKKKKKLAKAQ